MSVIHWYPGHMKKASIEMIESLKLVDIVIELVDARAPILTRNPFFKDTIKSKKHLLIYMKSDLADLTKIKLDNNSVLFSINDKNSISVLTNKIYDLNKEKRDKEIKKGIKPLLPKVMVVGIPNIGKSSLINALIGHKITKVENKPGLTKNNRWVNVKDKFYLLDTPGILPTSYDDNNYILALIGAIKIDLLPIIDLSEFAYDYIIKNYPNLFIKKYGAIKENSSLSFKHISNMRGIKNDNSLNFEKAREIFLKDIRDGRLGKIYFEIKC